MFSRVVVDATAFRRCNLKRNPIICIAPDSFKGVLDARGVSEAIADGIVRVFPSAVFRMIPMADGGEGTVSAWAAATAAEIRRVQVSDPLGRLVWAEFAFDESTRTAVIEMAAASGLPLLARRERNPLITSTYGTGELIRAALDLHVRRIILGIGGSATNDGGAGMLTALGVRFLDSDGVELPQGGAGLRHLAKIDLTAFDPRIREVEIQVACDVTNPLCGSKGASAVYGPQKGASPEDVAVLDGALGHFADVVEDVPGAEVMKGVAVMAGAGAAGGLGFALCAFCGAKLCRGVEIIAQSVDLLRKIEGSDLVITGEGRLDGQTVHGKTPAGVAAVAEKAGVPCIAICGCVGEGYEAVHGIGIRAVVPIAHGFFDPENPSLQARERIMAAAEETARLLAGVRL